MHDLRRMLYSHIQRLSLAYHDQKQTGDLISRVTSDIDAIQSFITSGLLGVDGQQPDAGRHGRRDVLHQLALHADRALGGSAAVSWWSTVTPADQESSREVRKKEGEIVSVIQEVLTSIRVVKAFAREDTNSAAGGREPGKRGDRAAARSLKAKLSPLVEIIVAVGTAWCCGSARAWC